MIGSPEKSKKKTEKLKYKIKKEKEDHKNNFHTKN